MDVVNQEPETAAPLHHYENHSREVRRGELVNGYVVYTRRIKRSVCSENEEASDERLRTCEVRDNVGFRAEEGGSGEVVLSSSPSPIHHTTSSFLPKLQAPFSSQTAAATSPLPHHQSHRCRHHTNSNPLPPSEPLQAEPESSVLVRGRRVEPSTPARTTSFWVATMVILLLRKDANFGAMGCDLVPI